MNCGITLPIVQQIPDRVPPWDLTAGADAMLEVAGATSFHVAASPTRASGTCSIAWHGLQRSPASAADTASTGLVWPGTAKAESGSRLLR